MASTLLIACGAIAHELVSVFRANAWVHVDIQCLPAEWHNTPERITPAVEAKIRASLNDYSRILVAYGDCGTGGQLDIMLNKYGVDRLPGDHCYSFFTGNAQFEKIAQVELGTFYLTDYLTRNFDRLILQGLGISEHPELRDVYFAHYTRVLYLVQQPDPELLRRAQAAADALGLPLQVHHTALAPMEQALRSIRIVPVSV